MKCVAVVLSGGKGKRMNSDIAKQYLPLLGKPVLYYSLKAFEDSFIDEIVIVCAPGDEEYVRQEIVLKFGFSKITRIVSGGAERYNSVHNGLAAIDECDYVFIHDGARPYVTQDMLKRLYEDVKKYKSAVAGVPSKDTVKILDGEGFVVDTPVRSSVWLMQTPQVFDFYGIKEAYIQAVRTESGDVTITDDAMVMENFGRGRVKITEGDYRNIKITTPEDMKTMEGFLSDKQ